MHTPAPLSQMYVATPMNISLGVLYRQIGIICLMCLLAISSVCTSNLLYGTVEQGAKGKILTVRQGGGEDSLSTV